MLCAACCFCVAFACELKAEPTGEEAKGPMMKRWRALKKWALCGLGSLRGSEQKKAVARSEALRMLAGLPTPVVVNSESDEELIPDPLEAELAKPSGSEPPGTKKISSRVFSAMQRNTGHSGGGQCTGSRSR